MGDVLGRVRYRGDSFLIERNGKTVAVLKPYRAAPPRDIREVLDAWRKAAPADLPWATAAQPGHASPLVEPHVP